MVNKKRPQPHRVRPALCEATGKKLALLNGFYERLYCATLSLTAYYSTLKYLCQELSDFVVFFRGLFDFARVCNQTRKLNSSVARTSFLLLGLSPRKPSPYLKYGKHGRASIPMGCRVNRAVTPAAKLIGAARKNGWSSVRCRCGQTIKSKSVTTRRVNLYNSRGG